MKAFAVWAAAVLAASVLTAAEGHLIGHWDFVDAKGDTVPGKVGPAGKIIRLGEGAEIVQRGGKTMLNISGQSKPFFLVQKMALDPAKPFTVLCDFFFDEEISHREGREFFSVTDGGKGPGVRVFFAWGLIRMRTGDGNTVQEVTNKANRIRIPCGRMAQLAAVYDGKTAALYVDGKKIAEEPFTIQPNKRRNLIFGNFPWGTGSPLNGALGNLRVYDQPLSAQEIAEQFLSEQADQE